MKKQEFLNEVEVVLKTGFNRDLIARAWDFAEVAHREQRRASGESYFLHPVSVALRLLDVCTDSCSIASALLHDVVEDTATSLDEIGARFGMQVAKLVEGVTKVSPLELGKTKKHQKSKQKANFRKLLLAIVDDPRVALIKLADRVNNLASLGALPSEKIARIAQESLVVHAPIAEALGVDVFRREIQECSFRHLYPDEYAYLNSKMETRREDFDEMRALVVAFIENELEEAGVDVVKVDSRRKELYSIFCKIKATGLSFEELYDVVGIRIITRNKDSCYDVQNVIQSMGVVVERNVDYIESPRGDLKYRSIHMIVRENQTRVEIQIRSEEMHDCAERGAAAHWLYKIGERDPDGDLAKRVRSLRNRLECIGSSMEEFETDGDTVMQQLAENNFKELVYVLSPDGKIVRLPAKSSPLDYAYHVHTNLGNECVGAKVNGQLVGLGYTLEDQDRVEIIRNPKSHPKLAWIREGKARSARAKAKIRHYLRRERRPELVAYGRALIKKRLPDGLDVSLLSSQAFSDGLVSSDDIECFLIAVAEKGADNTKVQRVAGKVLASNWLGAKYHDVRHIKSVLRQVVPESRLPSSLMQLQRNLADHMMSRRLTQSQVVSPGKAVVEEKSARETTNGGGLAWGIATCCNPHPRDEEPILGYTSTRFGHGPKLQIHRSRCAFVVDPANIGKVLPVSWESLDGIKLDFFSVVLFALVSSDDSSSSELMYRTVSVVGGVVRQKVRMGKTSDGVAQYRMEISMSSDGDLQKLIVNLRQLPGIEGVRREYEDFLD